VVEDLSRRITVDRTRIYATGHSNGAGMAYRLGLEAPDLVAAIAPVAGASMGVATGRARPTPVLHIHNMDHTQAHNTRGYGQPGRAPVGRGGTVILERSQRLRRGTHGAGEA
jgi:polyhydroxybutyrate depolymerase